MKTPLLTIFAALALPAAAWQPIRDLPALEEEHEIFCPAVIAHGAPFVRVRLKNALPAVRTFKLQAYCNRSATMERSLTLGPGATATTTFPMVFVADHGYEYGGIHVRIREPVPPAGAGGSARPAAVVDCYDRPDYWQNSSDTRSLMLAAPLSGAQGGWQFELAAASAATKTEAFDAPKRAADWPDDYRAYLPFDAVLLPPSTLAELPTGARRALEAYKTLGGEVILTDEGESGGFRRTDAARAAMDGIERAHARLAGGIEFDFQGRTGENGAENIRLIPLEIVGAMPLGGILALLAAFAIVAVPAVLAVCARKNRRMLALAILPALAVAISLAVALAAMAHYNLTPSIRLQSATWLDQSARQAVTLGQFGVFSPVDIEGEMVFPGDSAVRLRDTRGEEFDGRVVCLDDGRFRLAGTWTQPLTAAFFDFSRCGDRSEKLDVRPLDRDRIAIVNLLGAPIETGRVFVRDREYALGPLAPGERAELDPAPATPRETCAGADAVLSKATAYGRDWAATADRLLLRTRPPGDGYAVKLSGSPFFPNPLGARRTRGSIESIVVGRIGKEAR